MADRSAAGAPTTEPASERVPSPSWIPRDTDERPSQAMPQAGFADWREQAEWWERTCVYWREFVRDLDARAEAGT